MRRITDDTVSPDADLSPLDKACSRKINDPDRHGVDAGVAWAAWEKDHSTEDRTYWEYVMVLPSGEHVLRTKSGRYRQRTPYHQTAEWEDIPTRCLRTFMRLSETERPLEALQKQFREEQEQKARKREQEVSRRKRKKREYEGAQKHYGKSNPSSMEVRDYRNRGNHAGMGAYR